MAYTTTAGASITVEDSSSSEVLEEGERIERNQIIIPGAQLGVYPETDIIFPVGSEGTIYYVAEANLGPITVVYSAMIEYNKTSA